MMRRRLAAMALMACIARQPLLAQKQVSMLATVTDQAGKEVTTIDPGLVTVREDGNPLAVSTVEPVERVPKLQILVDNGAGFPSTNLSDMRNAIKALLNSLPPGLEVTLVTTAPQPRVLEKATTSRARLLAAADRLTQDSHAGKFVDSIYEAADRAGKDPLETAVYTIITIGSTVGDSSARESDVNKALTLIYRKKIPVYAVLFSNVSANTGQVQQEMAQAAIRANGGRLEVLNSATRLMTLLPEIGASLAGNLGGRPWIRITAQRSSAGPMGHIGVSARGYTVIDLMLDETRTK
jgi:hypothetical protein